MTEVDREWPDSMVERLAKKWDATRHETAPYNADVEVRWFLNTIAADPEAMKALAAATALREEGEPVLMPPSSEYEAHYPVRAEDVDVSMVPDEELVELAMQLRVRVCNGGNQDDAMNEAKAEILRRIGSCRHPHTEDESDGS